MDLARVTRLDVPFDVLSNLSSLTTLSVVIHQGCLAVFLVNIYSNVDGHLCFFTSVLFLVGLNAAITYSCRGAFKEPLRRLLIHTPHLLLVVTTSAPPPPPPPGFLLGSGFTCTHYENLCRMPGDFYRFTHKRRLRVRVYVTSVSPRDLCTFHCYYLTPTRFIAVRALAILPLMPWQAYSCSNMRCPPISYMKDSFALTTF